MLNRRTDLLLVAVGGMAGALSRFSLGWLLDPFAVGVGLFIANLSGALMLALISLLGEQRPRLRALLGTGFCGSFTSVSALNGMVVLSSNTDAIAGWIHLMLSIACALSLVCWLLRWHPDQRSGGLSQ